MLDNTAYNTNSESRLHGGSKVKKPCLILGSNIYMSQMYMPQRLYYSRA